MNEFTSSLLLCSGVMFKMIWYGTLVRDHNLEQLMCSSKLVILGIKVNRTKSNFAFVERGSKSDYEKRSRSSEEN